jgi:hypothetical protein
MHGQRARAGRWNRMLPMLLLALAVVHALPAQSRRVEGTWEAATAAGSKITLVLRQDGRRVTGTLSGNGAQFAVEGELEAEATFYGTVRSRDGALFIAAELDGASLGVGLAEMNAAGVPDLRNAQQIRMQRVTTAGGAGTSSAGGGVPSGGGAAGAGGAAPAGPPASAPAAGLAPTPADRQLADLLISSVWCNLQYSQQMGATTVERVVFGRDGRIASRTQRESAVNNSQGSYYGLGTDAVQGWWRVRGAQLQLSQDGQAYAAVPLNVSRNSNGYPIITTNNKEYYQCQ